MCGDEEGLCAIFQDTISVGVVDSLDVSTKLMACVGFGTETEEGVVSTLSGLREHRGLDQRWRLLWGPVHSRKTWKRSSITNGYVVLCSPLLVQEATSILE